MDRDEAERQARLQLLFWHVIMETGGAIDINKDLFFKAMEEDELGGLIVEEVMENNVAILRITAFNHNQSGKVLAAAVVGGNSIPQVKH